MRKNAFLKNAALLTVGGFIAKGLGGLYRIPLANLLGGYGMGLYQMAYPLFCVLLTFSSAGIPNAFARLVARERAKGKDGFSTVKTALRLFCMLGLCGALAMCLLAPLVARLQGEPALKICYFALAPAVFFVAGIAVLRGYFQGKSDMAPTALSEVLEQLVKVSLGLYFAYRYKANAVFAVTGTLFAVTLSELFALGWLVVRYRGEKRRYLANRSAPVAGILDTAIPAMAAASLLPLSQMVDSIVLVRLMAAYTSRSVALYGLFSGGALALINLPATLSYGLAAASVPTVSEAFSLGEKEEGKRRVFYALGITLAIALPCAVGLLVLAKPIVTLLYPSLSGEDVSLLVSLVRICAFSAVTLAGVQTLSACLTGMGRAKKGALSMAIAVVVKFAVQIALVQSPNFSIMGGAIAADACYLVAFFLDLYYTVKQEKHNGEGHDYRSQFGSRKRRLERAGAGGDFAGRQGARPYGTHRVGAQLKRGGHRLRITRFRIRKEP